MANLDELIKRTKKTRLRDLVTKRVLQTIHVMVEKRIFDSGIDVKGSLIGVYSEPYQKTRRKKGYPISRKVILQAESQMVNDFKLLVLGGEYGSGFTNNFNYDKSKWVEDTYNYQRDGIFGVSKSEDAQITKLMDKELQKVFNKL